MKKMAVLALLILPALARAQSAPAPPVFATRGAFVALSVPDLEASVRWYSEKLGLRVTQRPAASDGVGIAIMEGGGLLIELLQLPKAVSLKQAAPAIDSNFLVHGIFKAGLIVDHYDELLASLRARDVAIALGPFPAREGQRANFIIRDNAGNLLQFFK